MKTAVVTGASSGIGEATARLLGSQGWRLLLVARREDRLRALAAELPDAAYVAVDLTDADAPGVVKAEVEERLGGLQLLVNNAGAGWRAEFGDDAGGWANVERTMEINFNAVVRLTEALLPILRQSAPSSIVNVGSVSGRVALGRTGAYSASKFALAGWSDALRFEEGRRGVHVGLVLPGFTATEGFPQDDLRAKAATRWIVSTPEKVAEAVVEAGPGGKPERTVPRGYGVFSLLRAVAPPVVRRVGAGMRR